jgi:hypothetical protein
MKNVISTAQQISSEAREVYGAYHVEGLSIKIASVTKKPALNFSVTWEAHLDVLKS